MTTKRDAVYDIPQHHTTLWEEQKTDHADTIGERGDEKVAGFNDAIMPAVFHSLYATVPNKVDKPGRGAGARKRIHDLIEELPEFETLRKQTVRDEMWAAMATAALCDSVVQALPSGMGEPPADLDEADRILDGLKYLQEENPDADMSKSLDKAQDAADAAAEALDGQTGAIDDTTIRNKARQGIAKAQEQIQDADAAMSALGYGSGAGTGGTGRNPAVAIQLARRIASSETLKRVVEIAGRLTATARAKRASRTEYARSEMNGVEPTDKIQRILPSEMLNLTTPLGTAVLFRKLVERNAMGYSMKGNEKVGKGPIVLMIDQSGSMMGDKDIWAKGISLALLDAARSEKRAFGVILYDDGILKSKLFPDPEKADPTDILDLLSTYPSGGTEFSQPTNLALDWIQDAATAGKFKKADIVHVTDGSASTDGAEQAMQRAKNLDCAVYGIAIGTDHYGNALAAWTTEPVTQITDVSRDAKAVDTIFDNIG